MGESILINEIDYKITSDKNDINIEELLGLFKQTYWAKDRDKQVILKSVENSLCFSLFHKAKQIGFARVVTDYCDFAYLADVIIDEKYRGIGIGTYLLKYVIEEMELLEIRRVCLMTRDAQEFYKRFGFCNLENPIKYMEIVEDR